MNITARTRQVGWAGPKSAHETPHHIQQWFSEQVVEEDQAMAELSHDAAETPDIAAHGIMLCRPYLPLCFRLRALTVLTSSSI